MRPPVFSVLKTGLLIVCILVCGASFGQEDSTEIVSPPKLNRKTERDPKLLVAALTADKTDDLEKFDAIFSWVATNIQYNYRQYFSGEGSSSKTDILSVLRRKKAICFQYAELMNQLCGLAEIQNVTISGYSKGMLFDINDSLYFDDHAWNAVRLNDKWYLYDVTWAAGGYEYRLSRFSERILRWREAILLNKQKNLKTKIIVRQKANKFCNIPKHKEKKIRMVMGLPFFWRIINGLLSHFPEKMVIDYGSIRNNNYYLTDPELFAITHFPNVPYWSLTTISNVREFSADSSYYDFNPNQLLVQKREGTDCPECDMFLSLAPLEQQRETIRLSLENNPKNGVEPAGKYFQMADHFYEAAKNATDSLEKMQGYDSTLACLEQAKKLLKQSRPYTQSFRKFHSSKEEQKEALLKRNNQEHIATNIVNVTEMRKRANKVRLMSGKIKNNQRAYYRNYKGLERFRAKQQDSREMNEHTAETTQKQLDAVETSMDSLNDRIDALKDEFTVRLNNLSDRIWDQTKLLQPQNNYFRQCAFLRIRNSLDDRDKPIAEIQDSIRYYEQKHQMSTLENVLLPCDTLYAVYSELDRLIQIRDRKQTKALKLYAKLYTGKSISIEEWNANRDRFIERTKNDYCYFFKHVLPLLDFKTGFLHFRNSHYTLYKTIQLDTRAESGRHKVFLSEILLTKKRIARVIKHNLTYQSRYKQAVLREKRTAIKKLKTAEKE